MAQNKRKEAGIMKEEITTERVGYSRSARRTHRNHSPPYSARRSYAYEDSMSSP
jgi:hypothetical protein